MSDSLGGKPVASVTVAGQTLDCFLDKIQDTRYKKLYLTSGDKYEH